MILVIDANIAGALLIELPYSAQARNAVAKAQAMIAPDLIYAEITNALWKMSPTRGSAAHDFAPIVARLPVLFAEIVASRLLMGEALRLALALKHPAYDCFYIALALSRRAPLITADRKLARAITGHGIQLDVIFVEPGVVKSH